MTTPVRVLGSANLTPAQTAAITLPALTIQGNVSVNVAITPPEPASTAVPTVTVTGKTTTYFDQPGMVPFPVVGFYIQQQSDAIASAAKNTAKAFGLNQTTASDQAVIYNQALFLAFLKSIPPRSNFSNVTQVLIPN